MACPSPFTPLGAKGIGEGNNMSTPVCLANAVADALGVSDVRLPLTPSRVHALLAASDPEPGPEPGSAVRAEVSGTPAPGSGPTGAGGDALHMSGSVQLAASPEQVYAVLMDPDALASVIPGCHALERVGENTYRAE